MQLTVQTVQKLKQLPTHNRLSFYYTGYAKNVPTCFCQNSVKSPSNLIISSSSKRVLAAPQNGIGTCHRFDKNTNSAEVTRIRHRPKDVARCDEHDSALNRHLCCTWLWSEASCSFDPWTISHTLSRFVDDARMLLHAHTCPATSRLLRYCNSIVLHRVGPPPIAEWAHL